MNLVERLEQACADAWPAMVDEPLGQWRMRAAGGFTGRANSTLVIGEPDRPVAAALRTVRKFAARHGIPPRAQVPVGAPAEPAIRAAGWSADQRHIGPEGVLVLTGPLSGLRGTDQASTGVLTRVDERPPAGWWPLVVDAAEPTPAQRQVLCGGSPVGFGTARLSGGAGVVAAVRGAVVGDLLHIARLAVAAEHRRRGIARLVLAALADWADPLGARRVVLQVTSTNGPAMRLYQRLGCTEHHRYQYWVPG